MFSELVEAADTQREKKCKKIKYLSIFVKGATIYCTFRLIQQAKEN